MKMDKKIIFSMLGVVIVVMGVAFVLWPRAPKGYSGKMESITIGGPISDAAALLFTAEDQHFLRRMG
jgi:hypothetical protein